MPPPQCYERVVICGLDVIDAVKQPNFLLCQRYGILGGPGPDVG